MKDYLKQIMGEGNWEINKYGIVVPKKQKAIEKLEPEFIPDYNPFGLNDKGQLSELIAVMKNRGIVRVNLCYPLDVKNKILLRKSLALAEEFKKAGFLLSVCNIDSIRKVKNVMGLKPAYLNKDIQVPEVEDHSYKEGLPFMPSVGGLHDVADRWREGYRVVKAIPYVKNDFHELTRRVNHTGGMLYNAAGGINPVKFNEAGEPVEADSMFKDIAELDSVIVISATQPVREVLNNQTSSKALEKFDKYLGLIQ